MADQFLLRIAKVVDAAIGGLGAALGGGNALWAHGVVDRPTADLDTFINSQDLELYEQAQAALIRAFEDVGMKVTLLQSDSWYRGLLITDPKTSAAARVDINYAYREHPPLTVDGVGAVLNLDDLMTGKLLALTSRAAERDYYDIDALLSVGRWNIHDLWAKLRVIRPTWSAIRFAEVLSSADQGDPVEYRALGMTQDQTVAMVARLKAYADTLRHSDA
jgi:hypothetical protein